MREISSSLKFLLLLSKTQSLLNRRFDSGLGGLGFTEFIILYNLSSAPDKKLKRIDLANKVGLTASGITRLLLPMEKIGLISKEVNPDDARVSYVLLAPGGKRKLEEGLERAEFLANEIIPEKDNEKIEDSSEILTKLTGTIN